jgi:hypothetical protein
MLKIYTLPNYTITIGVGILETQLSSLLYGCGASFGKKWSMPWMSANIKVPFLLILRFLCEAHIAASLYHFVTLQEKFSSRKHYNIVINKLL